MSRIPLIGKSYVEQSKIASAQETINYYPENNRNDPSAPVPKTYYPTPGLDLIVTPSVANKVRCTYRTSKGTSYIVVGPTVYQLATNGALSFVGTIGDNPSQVYMADNGLVAILVDGTSKGYAIELSTNNFASITDPSFYGADFVVYLLTFFVFNRPKTNQFYISLSEVTFGMLVGTAIQSGTIANGANYVPGVYQSVPLTGGSGIGATADITVVDGAIGTGVITTNSIATSTLTAGGAGYVTGVYNNVPLTGGAGTLATANITVNGAGVVSAYQIVDGGINYAATNILSASNVNLGGSGAGLQITVNTVSSGSGTNYVPGTYKAVPLTGGQGSGAIADIVVGNSGSVTSVIFANENDNTGQNFVNGNVLSASNVDLGNAGNGFTFTITSIVNGAVGDVSIGNPGEGFLVGDVLSANNANLGGSGAGFTYTLTATALAFDPLDIAAKSGSADPIVAILAIHEELWLIGALTSEIWQGTGAADFFFQQVQGAYIDHGCIALYSATNTDVLGYWLMQDRQGKNIVVEGSGYDVTEISTPFLVKEFNSYTTTADAIGFCFQINQHPFYCLIFPTANITWLYDIQGKEWSKWLWLDVNTGLFNRHRANCAMFFNNQVVIGDWQNGSIYNLNAATFTDAGNPIIRIKTFLHMLDNFDRAFYRNFDLDVEVGSQDPTIETVPQVFLDWSDDRGMTYGQPIGQTLGQGGQFKTTVTWNRLGMARDRIFRIKSSEAVDLALNGGFCEVAKGRT